MKYKTKQTDILIDVLREIGNNGITANKMTEIFEDRYNDVSKATIYRKLKIFEEEGIVRVINKDGKKYYSLVSDACHEHLHLICTNCNKIEHLNSKKTNEFIKYLEKKYKFEIDFSKTVIYGICEDCE